MPVNILNLPGLDVVDFRETATEYHVRAKPKAISRLCPGCGSSRKAFVHQQKTLFVRDLPSHGRAVAIHLDVPRLKCHDCVRTFTAVVPEVDADRQMTERLVKWIGRQSLEYPFTEIAKQVGLDEKTVRASTRYRSEIAELKRRITSLEQQLKVAGRLSRKPAQTSETPEPAANVRFRADGLKKHRARLGLSAPVLASILGVSSQTVYNWEAGTSKPSKSRHPIDTASGSGNAVWQHTHPAWARKARVKSPLRVSRPDFGWARHRHVLGTPWARRFQRPVA